MKENIEKNSLKVDIVNIINACRRQNSKSGLKLINAMKLVLLWKFIATIKLHDHCDLREFFDTQLSSVMDEHVEAMNKSEYREDIKKFIKILS